MHICAHIEHQTQISYNLGQIYIDLPYRKKIHLNLNFSNGKIAKFLLSLYIFRNLSIIAYYN